MERVYKSKLGLELMIPVFGVFGLVIIAMLTGTIQWLGLIIMVSITLFITHLFLTTYYAINDVSLRIKCGFIYNTVIKIDSIKKINETNNPLSSPATSLDRLEVFYNKFDSVLISPKEKDAFIADLIKQNPQIVVKYKIKKH